MTKSVKKAWSLERNYLKTLGAKNVDYCKQIQGLTRHKCKNIKKKFPMIVKDYLSRIFRKFFKEYSDHRRVMLREFIEGLFGPHASNFYLSIKAPGPSFWEDL